MEKVWFKFRQTHYPPPTVDSMGTDKETGPICLGHFIKDLKHIDFVLNRGELEEFPANMPVHTTTAFDFKWDSSKVEATGTHLEGGAPIAAAAGMTVKGNLQLMFKSPSRIMVARGTRQRIASESKDKSVDVGPEIDVPGIATATATLTLERGQAQTIGHGGASDFVFAVRLAKASKNLLQTVLQRDWSLDESYTKKATFDTATGKVDIGAVVEREGLANYHVLEGDDLDFALVAISDEVETEGELEPKSEQHYEPTQGGKAKDG